MHCSKVPHYQSLHQHEVGKWTNNLMMTPTRRLQPDRHELKTHFSSQCLKHYDDKVRSFMMITTIVKILFLSLAHVITPLAKLI